MCCERMIFLFIFLLMLAVVVEPFLWILFMLCLSAVFFCFSFIRSEYFFTGLKKTFHAFFTMTEAGYSLVISIETFGEALNIKADLGLNRWKLVIGNSVSAQVFWTRVGQKWDQNVCRLRILRISPCLSFKNIEGTCDEKGKMHTIISPLFFPREYYIHMEWFSFPLAMPHNHKNFLWENYFFYFTILFLDLNQEKRKVILKKKTFV